MRFIAVSGGSLRRHAVPCGALRFLAAPCGALRALRFLVAPCGALRCLAVPCGASRPLRILAAPCGITRCLSAPFGPWWEMRNRYFALRRRDGFGWDYATDFAPDDVSISPIWPCVCPFVGCCFLGSRLWARSHPWLRLPFLINEVARLFVARFMFCLFYGFWILSYVPYFAAYFLVVESRNFELRSRTSTKKKGGRCAMLIAGRSEWAIN